MKSLASTHKIEQHIYLLRGQKVMLDRDLAEIYQVPTKVLNQAVKRHRKRFPEDFMFRMSQAELENWRSQIVTSNPAAKMGLRRPPYAFTEHGAVMLASALNSHVAVQASIQIVRAFIRLREVVSAHKELARKLGQLERHVKTHDRHIRALFEAIRELMLLPKASRRIGFHKED